MKHSLLVFLLVLTMLVPGCNASSGEKESADTPPEVLETGEESDAGTTVTGGDEEKETTGTGQLSPDIVHFTASSPVAVFTDEDIAYLGIECSGTDTEIADCIRIWQVENMVYGYGGGPDGDMSDPIRWNYFLPGIFSSKDIIYEQVTQGKVYGICFNFAVVYASIAEYYGLETRVVSTISKPSDSNPTITFTDGMAPAEYERLKVKLDALGLNYDYEAVRLVAEETPTHYWAEVRLNGEWISLDASQASTGGSTEAEFISTGDFEVVDWLSRDMSATLEAYQQKLDNGERLPQSGDGSPPSTGTVDGAYTGINDDLGQTGRAANIDDLMAGLALAPYFENIADAYDFINLPDSARDLAGEDQAIKDRYEEITGRSFYLVAWLACDEKEGAALAECYFSFCGEELDLDTYARADTE